MSDLTKLPEAARRAIHAYRCAAYQGEVRNIDLIMAMEDLSELLEHVDRPVSTREDEACS